MSFEAMKLALEAMESHLTYHEHGCVYLDPAVTALRQAIEQAQPVAWQWLDTAHFRKHLPKDAEPGVWRPLYTAPPQRKPLTDEEADELVRRFARYELLRATEAAHGIKENT
jgi:hypothetical protein